MFGFGDMLEVFDCTFEIEVGNSKNVQRMQAPKVMIQNQFLNLVQDAAKDANPVRIELKRDVPCYDEWNNTYVQRENSIEFKNKSYIKMEEEE